MINCLSVTIWKKYVLVYILYDEFDKNEYINETI